MNPTPMRKSVGLLPLNKKRIAFEFILFFSLSLEAANTAVLGARFSTDTYTYLYSVMDKYHRFVDNSHSNQTACFNVYTDKDAAGNHFIPSGAMGDWGDIVLR